MISKVHEMNEKSDNSTVKLQENLDKFKTAEDLEAAGFMTEVEK